jgi:hypothetical protein
VLKKLTFVMIVYIGCLKIFRNTSNLLRRRSRSQVNLMQEIQPPKGPFWYCDGANVSIVQRIRLRQSLLICCRALSRKSKHTLYTANWEHVPCKNLVYLNKMFASYISCPVPDQLRFHVQFLSRYSAEAFSCE